MENRERAKGAPQQEKHPQNSIKGDIADAVKNLQRAVSIKLQTVIRNNITPEIKKPENLLPRLSEAKSKQNTPQQAETKDESSECESNQADKDSKKEVDLEPIELVSKEEDNLNRMLMEFEDEEEKFIRMEFQIQKTQDELLGNADFQYLLQKSEDLFSLYYNPSQAKKYRNPHHMQKLLAEITK